MDWGMEGSQRHQQKLKFTHSMWSIKLLVISAHTNKFNKILSSLSLFLRIFDILAGKMERDNEIEDRIFKATAP